MRSDACKRKTVLTKIIITLCRTGRNKFYCLHSSTIFIRGVNTKNRDHEQEAESNNTFHPVGQTRNVKYPEIKTVVTDTCYRERCRRFAFNESTNKIISKIFHNK